MTKPTPEQIARMLNIWDNAPLCNNVWLQEKLDLDEDTRLYHAISAVCPITALLRAAGISDEELLLGMVGTSPDTVWKKYGAVLQEQYGLTLPIITEIVDQVDDSENYEEAIIPDADDIKKIALNTINLAST